jgi:transposase
MYGELWRKVKTDRRDVAALAEANRRGWYRAAYRVTPAQRIVRQQLQSRKYLVEARSGAISLVRALLRQTGERVASCGPTTVAARVRAMAVPPRVASSLDPLCRAIEALTAEIAVLDETLQAGAAADAVVPRLQTVPGVGPIVALAFRAFVDDVGRFPSAAHVSAALGLVPREDSSAERRHRGHITKAGPSGLRSLLVQAAWVCWCRAKGSRGSTLRAWTDQLAARRGKRIAVVALARRLSRILYALWRDDTTFRAVSVAA